MSITYLDLLPYIKINREKLRKIFERILYEKKIIKYKEKDKKLRWDLLPWNTIESIVKVITKGAEKYGIDNWKTINNNMFEAAMFRHFMEYKKGKHIDKQWNLPHLSHFVCNAIFLLWKELLVIEIEKRGELKSIEASEKNKNGGKNNAW